jgi:hypothetical protein
VSFTTLFVFLSFFSLVLFVLCCLGLLLEGRYQRGL